MDEDGNVITQYNDEAMALLFEEARNGGLIDWDYWTRVEASAAQASRLAYSIDPIKWPGEEYAQGPIPAALLEKIGKLHQWLVQNWPFPTITLGHLVRRIGEQATWTLKNAAAGELAAMDAHQLAEIAGEKARTDAGRRTLEEIAQELAENTSIAIDRWLAVVVNAVERGALPLRNPQNYDDDLPYSVPHPLRTFYDQVHFADVNRWLDKNAEWTEFRFDTLAVDVASTPSNRGLSIIDIEPHAWPVRIKLADMMSDPRPWLRRARKTKGRRGGASSTWDPVLLAVCLCDKGHSSFDALDRHVRKAFPAWLSQWEQASEHLNPAS